MTFYVVAYDIPDNKRRKQVADLLEGYGKRVQYSVFECVLTPPKYQQLRSKLKKKVNLKDDSVRFYPLSSQNLSCVETWGGQPITTLPGSVVV